MSSGFRVTVHIFAYHFQTDQHIRGCVYVDKEEKTVSTVGALITGYWSALQGNWIFEKQANEATSEQLTFANQCGVIWGNIYYGPLVDTPLGQWFGHKFDISLWHFDISPSDNASVAFKKYTN